MPFLALQVTFCHLSDLVTLSSSGEKYIPQWNTQLNSCKSKSIMIIKETKRQVQKLMVHDIYIHRYYSRITTHYIISKIHRLLRKTYGA